MGRNHSGALRIKGNAMNIRIECKSKDLEDEITKAYYLRNGRTCVICLAGFKGIEEMHLRFNFVVNVNQVLCCRCLDHGYGDCK